MACDYSTQGRLIKIILVIKLNEGVRRDNKKRNKMKHRRIDKNIRKMMQDGA